MCLKHESTSPIMKLNPYLLLKQSINLLLMDFSSFVILLVWFCRLKRFQNPFDTGRKFQRTEWLNRTSMKQNITSKRFILICRFNAFNLDCKLRFINRTFRQLKYFHALLFLNGFWFHFRYKSTMRLNITKIRSQDYGEYHCVSKNEMGIARAVFHLQGNDFQLLLLSVS